MINYTMYMPKSRVQKPVSVGVSIKLALSRFEFGIKCKIICSYKAKLILQAKFADDRLKKSIKGA